MIEALQVNLWLMYFLYGLSFYTMGIAVAFQYRGSSRFRLADSLRLLAAFGLMHGISEWGSVFIPVQASSLDLESVWKAVALQRLLQSVSFFLLFCFGTKLIIDSAKKKRWLYALPVSLFVIWLIQFAFFIPLLGTNELAHWLLVSESWARYLLALPAGLFTAYGLILQIPAARELNYNSVYDLWIATILFGMFSLFSGLVVPNRIGGLSQVINVHNFWQHIGLHIEVFRTATALMITWSITRILGIFNLETQRQITESRRREAVYSERERFARDLHDDIIQSVYGIGLELQSTLTLLPVNQAQAESRIKSATVHLHEVINNLRAYIEGLTTGDDYGLQTELGKLVEQFSQQTDMEIVLNYELAHTAVNALVPDGWQQQFVQIVHEALSNIVVHAAASKAQVSVKTEDCSLVLVVTDNGTGMANALTDQAGRTHHGMQNMRARANLLAGTFDCRSTRGIGTEVVVRVPFAKEEIVR